MTIFFRLLDAEDKGTALQEAIAALPQNPTPEAFTVNPESFEQVPKSPFAYWVSNEVKNAFSKLKCLESKEPECKATQGISTANDTRFARI